MSIVNDYETLAFFGLAGGFEILERYRPAREVDRWKHLKIDILSFALAILMNRISQYSITGFLKAHAPAPMLGGWFVVQGLPDSVRIFLAIMLTDFVIYWIHRGQHAFGPLWQTHQWHHSTEQLYWFSGFRVSFLHTFIYNIPEAAMVEHNRTNFGATFSLWDRMFGTYSDPAKVPSDTPLGLGEPYGARRMARMLVGF